MSDITLPVEPTISPEPEPGTVSISPIPGDPSVTASEPVPTTAPQVPTGETTTNWLPTLTSTAPTATLPVTSPPTSSPTKPSAATTNQKKLSAMFAILVILPAIFNAFRAQENASVLGGVAIERNLLWQELKSRFIAQKERAQIQAVPTPIVPAGPATTL
ncbi:hypothetical protein BX616_008715 [Lobosporangium transversale]|nr:hypothetical protein BX616_008715 [Lobosporangium transversale]